MTMPTDDANAGPSVSDWSERERQWAARLGRRILLGGEAVDVQLARVRQTTWVLTLVAGFMASILFGIFTAFRAPLIGLIVAGAIFGTMVALAWLDVLRLSGRVRAYLEERRRSGV